MTQMGKDYQDHPVDLSQSALSALNSASVEVSHAG
jgi:hypothetical protein